MAHEFSQAMPLAHTHRSWRLPLVIGIDADGYRDYFLSRSPLPRNRILKLLQVVQAHTPPSTRIALNFSVAPAEGADPFQRALDAFLREQPRRWILPAWPGEVTHEARAWREGLCAHGVSFGRPDVPTDFGYASLSHQYVDAQAELLALEKSSCADPAHHPVSVAQALLAASLETGTVLRFQGDLDGLAETLDLLSPEVVMIGNVSGPQGLFGTPVGERYAVQIQAAALAGAWNGEHLASRNLCLLSAWILVTLLWILLSFLLPWLDRWLRPPLTDMSGHQFLALRARHVVVVLVLGLCLFIWIHLGSLLHAVTGFWISADLACGLTLMFTLFTWSLGRHPVKRYVTPVAAWREGYWQPVQAAWSSLRGVRQATNSGFDKAWAVVALLVQGAFPLLACAHLWGILRGSPWW